MLPSSAVPADPPRADRQRSRSPARRRRSRSRSPQQRHRSRSRSRDRARRDGNSMSRDERSWMTQAQGDNQAERQRYGHAPNQDRRQQQQQQQPQWQLEPQRYPQTGPYRPQQQHYQQHQHQQHQQHQPRWTRPEPEPLSKHEASNALGDIKLDPPLHIRRQKIDALVAATAASSKGGEEAAAEPAAPAPAPAAAAAASSSAADSTCVALAAAASAPVAAISPSRCAFVTLVMLGDSYVPGALVLASSIRCCGSTAALVVMVSEDVSPSARADLALVFDQVLPVDLLEGRAVHKEWKRYTKAGAGGSGEDGRMYQWLDKSFTKFNVLSLVQYDRVCLLDADVLCASNPDAVWSLRAPAGICSTIASIAANDELHGQRLSESQVKESWKSYGMRGCFYLLQPNAAHLQLVRDVLREFGGYGERQYHIGADEKLFTDLYLDQWTHCHWRFGANSWKCGPDVLGAGNVAVFLHFVTEKPWAPKEVWPDTAQWGTAAQVLMEKHPQVKARFQAHLEAMERHAQKQRRK